MYVRAPAKFRLSGAGGQLLDAPPLCLQQYHPYLQERALLLSLALSGESVFSQKNMAEWQNVHLCTLFILLLSPLSLFVCFCSALYSVLVLSLTGFLLPVTHQQSYTWLQNSLTLSPCILSVLFSSFSPSSIPSVIDNIVQCVVRCCASLLMVNDLRWARKLCVKRGRWWCVLFPPLA